MVGNILGIHIINCVSFLDNIKTVSNDYSVYFSCYLCTRYIANAINVLLLNYWQSAGVDFPPREENSVPLFTPPQTHAVVHPTSPYEEAAIQASLQTDAAGLRYCYRELTNITCLVLPIWPFRDKTYITW